MNQYSPVAGGAMRVECNSNEERGVVQVTENADMEFWFRKLNYILERNATE